MMLPSTLKNRNEWTFLGPMGPELALFLKKYPLIAIDGGARYADELSIWVGDADSYQKEIQATHIFKHPSEKDQSDLALALSLFQDPLHYKFHFWGFLGGRKDHELFNLGEALTFLEHNQECEILFYDGSGALRFHLLGAGQWKFQHHGLFSVGTIKKTLVKLTGECKYSISKSQLFTPLSSFGLSNLGSGTIELENEGPIFLYFPEDQ